MGTNALIQNASNNSFPDPIIAGMSAFLTKSGIANTVLASSATISASDLAGRSLFVGFLPADGYIASELTMLSDYLNGSGSIILTGETSNSSFAMIDSAVNAALTAFGSGMLLVPGLIDPGYNTATVQTGNSATAGTAGLRYAYTSGTTGGTGYMLRHATAPGVSFLAAEGLTALPEPASWTMTTLGKGAIGYAMRRRDEVSTRVFDAIWQGASPTADPGLAVLASSTLGRVRRSRFPGGAPFDRTQPCPGSFRPHA